MDQVMNISDWYLFQGVNNVIGFQCVVMPVLLGLSPDEEAIRAAMPKAHIVINELSRLLGSQTYFAGETASLADLLVAPQLGLLARTPEWTELSADAANLIIWLDRMNERPSMQATTWERVSKMAEAASSQTQPIEPVIPS
jgi:glutathione S-transferase